MQVQIPRLSSRNKQHLISKQGSSTINNNQVDSIEIERIAIADLLH